MASKLSEPLDAATRPAKMTTTAHLPPEETCDLALQLLVEAGFYDARIIRTFGKLPLPQRSIVISNLLRELTRGQQKVIFARFARIEALTYQAGANG